MKASIKAVKKNGRFNLFFMEMMIVLLFFSIAAAVILRSFAASDRIARESERMESMAFYAQSAAEIYSRTASVSETANTLFGESFGLVFIDGTSSVNIPISSDFKYSPASPELFITMLETEEHCENGTLMKLEIIFSDSRGESVYKVESGAYISERTVSSVE